MSRRVVYLTAILVLFMLYVACSYQELILFVPFGHSSNNIFGGLRGNVKDMSNYAGILGAQVKLSSNCVGFSDETGEFFLKDVPPGEWEITVSAPHYFSFSTNITIQSSLTDTLSVELQRNNSEVIIATYNLADFDNPEDYDALAKWLKTAEIDIIAIQEIQPEDVALLNTALSAKGVTLPYYLLTVQYGFPNDYLAVWSRWPIYDSSEVVYPSYLDPIAGTNVSLAGLRPVFKFRINVLGTHPVWFYAAHLKAENITFSIPSDLQLRRAQALVIYDTIIASQNIYTDQIIILGNMNTALPADFSSDQTIDILSFRTDNPSNTTNDFIPVNLAFLPPDAWTVTNSDMRLDHIFLSPGIITYYVSNSVCIPRPFPNPSYHYPVVITLKY
jgi:endonuclease/exonuclease/phosphatase family metal-dependent hydrolase